MQLDELQSGYSETSSVGVVAVYTRQVKEMAGIATAGVCIRTTETVFGHS